MPDKKSNPAPRGSIVVQGGSGNRIEGNTSNIPGLPLVHLQDTSDNEVIRNEHILEVRMPPKSSGYSAAEHWYQHPAWRHPLTKGACFVAFLLLGYGLLHFLGWK